MVELNFDISEFCITDEVTPDIADKILHFHILPLQEIRNKTKLPIVVSDHSGYRPVKWEKSHKRDGTSQHTFRLMGAVDLEYYASLLKYLLSDSPYKRICFYKNNGFIHCDYKSSDKKRRYYECDSPTSKWKLIKIL